MLFRFVTYYLLIVVTLLASCNSDSSDSNIKKIKIILNQKESLIKVNKYMVNSESIEIDNYIRRHKLNVIKTGSGLSYQIIKHGNGEKAIVGKEITLNYKTKLITGDVIYSSKESAPKSFTIGHGGVESGLEEAILNMRVGDEAIIIIPSHLAFGLLGDRKKIPQRSTIIYEIEITNIK